MKNAIILILLFVVITMSYAGRATVVRVKDGDTIVIRASDGKNIDVRLYGIDAPEKEQSFGKAAAAALTEMIDGKRISYELMAVDFFYRAVMIIYYKEKCINEELVSMGLAWVYTEYCRDPYEEAWLIVQTLSNNRLQGIWSQEAPVAPWHWRDMKKKEGKK